MSRLVILAPALIAAFGLGFASLAQTAPTAAANSSSSQAAAKPAAARAHHVIKPGDRECLQHTGSLIPPKKGECLSVAGRSYSGDELRRTGAPTTAGALRMLDPSIH